MYNLFELPRLPLDEEHSTVLAKGRNMVRIERIVSTGQTSDWYDDPETEFVTLLSGSAVIEYADGHKVYLATGATLILQPHERHRVAFTSTDPPAIWLCFFYE